MGLRKLLLVVLIIAAGFFLLLVGYVYFNQSKLVFYPSREINTDPSGVGLAFEDVWIDRKGKGRLHGWYIQPDVPGETFPVVLFSHGNAGNISHRLETVRYICGLGAGILLYDYSGYGRSEGTPSEKGIYADIRSCFNWLIDTEGISADRIVLFGRSLGGVPTIDLAAEQPCRGVIVESSFTSAREMGRIMFPVLPTSLLIRYSLNSLGKIPRLKSPIVVAHSPDDEMIPYELGERLFEAAPEPKRFVRLRGNHNQLDYYADEDYLSALKWVMFRDDTGREN